jgi:uncharacterized membrane protein (UPF0127 family)
MLIVVLVFLAVLLLLQKSQKNKVRTVNPTKVRINGQEIFVEIADSPNERAKGLMFREKLDEDKGMLFIFENEDHRSFWMKNTYIPLDILWIDSKEKIVHIEKEVPPCETEKCPPYTSDAKAKYVLEVNSGWAEKNNVKIGDAVRFLK